MSNKPHPPTAEPSDPITELLADNDRRRQALRRQGVDVQVVEMLLGVILEELGDEARNRYAERLAAVLDTIEAQNARMRLLGGQP